MLAAAAALGALLMGGALLFLARPSVLVNERVAAFLLRRAQSYAPRWEGLSVWAHALPGRRHRYALELRGLCVKDAYGAVDACFETIELGALAAWSRRGPSLVAVERLRVAGRRVALRPGRSPAGEGGGSLAPLRRAAAGRLLPPWLAGARWEDFRVSLPELDVESGSTTVAGRLALSLEPRRALPALASADLRLRTPAGVKRLRARVEAGSDLLGAARPSALELRARGDYAGSPFRAGLLARRGQGEEGSLRLDGAWRGARAEGRGAARRVGGRWELAGGLELSAPGRGRLSLRRCRGEAGPAGDEPPRLARLDCRWEAVPARLPRAFPARALRGALSARARRAGPSGRETLDARLNASIEPVRDWYELSARASASLSGRPGAEARLSHELDARLSIPRFERLTAALRGTRWAVPAPLHVMTGPLSLRASSRGDPRSPLDASWSASADLSSARQRLAARASGTLAAREPRAPRPALESESELVLSDVAIELPRIDVGSVPQLQVDRRIVSEPPAERAHEPAAPVALPVELRGRLRVRTEKPARLLTNLAREPVPIDLDLDVSFPPAAAGGTVALRRFGIELFRREAVVDHVNLALSPGRRDARLEGLVLYRAAEATIRIILLGTTRRPLIDFASDPPMDRDQIIALLVYGRSPSELDLDQAQSVGNTQTALESKAFGLLSLYLFGSTPVETVTYDSVSRAYTVKLRIPGGASMELSSDFSQTRELRLRKLLAPHWAVQSEFRSHREEGGGGSAWLEWFNRY